MTTPFTMVSVRRARLDDLRYVDALRRHHSEALGFLPAVVYEWTVTGRGPAWKAAYRLWLAEVDCVPVGFLFLTPGRIGGTARIAQVCVQEDARRHEYASALVGTAEQHATDTQRGAVSLRVATDLAATEFWTALGYPLVRLEQGGQRRGRVLECRTKRLPLELLPARAGVWLPEKSPA